jgi:hypothetical protein
MPETPGGFPFPAGSDRPDVVRDIRALAEEVDVRLGSQRIWATNISIVVNNSTMGTAQTINYAAAGFTSNPRIMIQPVGTSGYIGISPSTPGLQTASINVRHVDGTVGSTNIPVHVLVIGS